MDFFLHFGGSSASISPLMTILSLNENLYKIENFGSYSHITGVISSYDIILAPNKIIMIFDGFMETRQTSIYFS